MGSAAEIAIGVAVEAGILTIAGVAVYRLFAGRFIIPKREAVLPFQQGVLVKRSGEMIAIQPGRTWVRPGQKLLLCDVRPRTIQLEKFETSFSDDIAALISLSGTYSITDPVQFFRESGNAADAFWFEVRRVLTRVCRQLPASAVSSSGGPGLIAERVLSEMSTSSLNVGVSLISFQVWDVSVRRGWEQRADEPDELIQ